MTKKGNTKLRTDEQITQTIRALLTSEQPEELLPIDILQTVRLLTEPYSDIGVHVSQSEMAHRLGCSRESVARSQERLVTAGWLKVSKASQTGKVNRLVVTVAEGRDNAE